MLSSATIIRSLHCGVRCLGKVRATALDSEQTELAMKFQTYFFYARRHPEVIYHAHSVPAGILAKELQHDINEGRFILESSPGPGILTGQLLKRGCKKLRVYERNKAFVDELLPLKKIYPHLEISNSDITAMAKMNIADQLGGTRKLERCLENLPKSSWLDEPKLTIVATLGRHRECGFLRSLIYAIPSRSLVFQHGRVDLLFFISGLEYKYMFATAEAQNLANYRFASVLYELFFECKVIDKVPRAFFLPQEFPEKGKVRSHKQDFYLVRLTPRKSIYGMLIPQNKLDEFVFFLKQCMSRRTAPVIPTLERFMPRVGVRLILDEGLKVFTQMGDLSPEKLARVFHVFSKMNGYHQSGFMSAYWADKQHSLGLSFSEDL